MIPADRAREAARSAVVQFTALLEYLDHIAKGRDGSPHVDAEDRSALDALRAALALPVEPAKPDEVAKLSARDRARLAVRLEDIIRNQTSRNETVRELVRLYENFAAERAAKEGG